jgi:cytochrome c oxidase cbb3-type subunit 3
VRHLSLAGVALWLGLLTAGCGEAPPAAAKTGNGVANGASPAMFTQVGPVPGPRDLGIRPQNPYQGDRTAIVEGRRIFVEFNCSGCHGGRAGGGMGPSLRDTVWHYGNADAQIFSTITEGRDEGMPAWGTKLPDDQIWKLVAYIQSMRTPNEPNPPR